MPTAMGTKATPRWKDSKTFINTSQWETGTHVIEVDDESTIEIVFHLSLLGPEVKPTTLVILESDRSRKNKNRSASLADKIGLSHISIFGDLTTNEFHEILTEIRRRIIGEIVFFGVDHSAADSFELAHVHQNSSALLVNPKNIKLNDLDNKHIPRRVFGIQDASDLDSIHEIASYLSAENFAHRGNGLYSNPLFNAFVFSNINIEEPTITDSLMKFLMESMADSAFSPRRIYVDGIAQGLFPRDFQKLPLDLRSPWDSGDLEVDIAFEPTDKGTSVTAKFNSKPTGFGGATNEISFYKQKEKIATKFGTIGTKMHIDMEADFATVSFRDGFGYELGTLSTQEIPLGEVKSPSIFILGSCVSRDAFDLENAPAFVDYRARTAIGSAFAPATSLIDSVNLSLNPSAFQRRMVETDLSKLLASALMETKFDFLLLDLIDERLQMIRDSGSYSTYSPELQTCGFKPSIDDLVEVGSAEYHLAFSKGLDNLLSIVPSRKIIVNEVFWAQNSVGGVPIGDPGQTSKHNLVLASLYRELRRIPGINFIVYPEDTFVSDPEHKWGLSPFHFGQKLYEKTLFGIEAVVEQKRNIQES